MKTVAEIMKAYTTRNLRVVNYIFVLKNLIFNEVSIQNVRDKRMIRNLKKTYLLQDFKMLLKFERKN